MPSDFPAAVPEIPVSDISQAAEYYVKNLGFKIDWGGEDGGIAGISKGLCRLFLTNPSFREPYGNAGPLMIWLNLTSKAEVNELYQQWTKTQARIVSEPEEKPWKLLEFTAKDLDGNLIRVFYDFSREV
jgi:predicted lactoylglutathione lyase